MAIKVSNTTVIDNSRNISNVNSFTATTFYGDGSNITGVGGGGELQATASGSISNGAAVIVNSNGTVSALNSNLTETNFVGFSDGSYSNGQTATIKVTGSVATTTTTMTIGHKYYVQTNGTLSTTEGSPSVYAGIAVGSTKIIVNG